MGIARRGLPGTAAGSRDPTGATATAAGASIELCALVLLGVFGSILLWGTPAQEGAAGRAVAGVQLLGFLSAVVSLIMLLSACKRWRTGTTDMQRAVPLVLGANLLFPILLDGIPQWGLPPAATILAVYTYTCLVGSAWKALGAGRTLAFATLLALLCYLVFALALQWQVRVWPTFIA